MKWIKISNREPTIKDLPFITYLDDKWEIWDDVDWFTELSERERVEYKYWLPLIKPE